MNKNIIAFTRPYIAGKELGYIEEAIQSSRLAGDGPFTKRCSTWLEDNTKSHKALLTHSCTAALEMSALLLDLEPGDEVIMPSYTFVSTANAFVLRGAIPVFVDIREDTLNLDESLIESAITSKTKAIVPVHYAGVSCEMDAIHAIASHYHLAVVEDAAQGLMASYKGKPLGSLGDFGALSFHETKNIIAGEGGALLVNHTSSIERAEVLREKGTNRSQFFRGEVDKYTWQDVGSSYLPSELIAAFLFSQLESAEEITAKRMDAWNVYHQHLASLASSEKLRRPIIPQSCQHNAHMYYILLNPTIDRQRVLETLKQNGIFSMFHYVPLHSSPAGKKFGRVGSVMDMTNKLSERLVRLPLWANISMQSQFDVIEALSDILHD